MKVVTNKMGTGMAARVMVHRFREVWVEITDDKGDVLILKPGCGGMQGDVTMPDMFCALYDEIIKEWMEWKKEEGQGIRVKHPVTDEEIDVSVTSFADDVMEMNLTKNAKEMLHTINESGKKLEELLEKKGIGQNRDKTENVMVIKGRNAVEENKTAMEWNKDEEVTKEAGKFCREAKYIGNVRETEGGTRSNTKTKLMQRKKDTTHSKEYGRLTSD